MTTVTVLFFSILCYQFRTIPLAHQAGFSNQDSQSPGHGNGRCLPANYLERCRTVKCEDSNEWCLHVPPNYPERRRTVKYEDPNEWCLPPNYLEWCRTVKYEHGNERRLPTKYLEQRRANQVRRTILIVSQFVDLL